MHTLDSVISQIQNVLGPVFQNDPTSIVVRLNENKTVDADLAVPCFAFTKSLEKTPIEVATLGAQALETSLKSSFDGIEVINGFINLKISLPFLAKGVLNDFNQHSPYGSSTIGNGKTVVTDFSSPNIAKPFSVGHLRSTVIGDAINNLHRTLGYTVVGDNHLGDWGTQFGKLIVAYLHWGDKEKVEANPIAELKDLYVRFHTEVEGKAEVPESQLDEEESFEAEHKDHPLVTEARDWFRKLESGDVEARKLWQWFVDISMKDFMEIYELLNVQFEEQLGESFYENKMAAVVAELENKGLLFTDKGGAKLVRTGIPVKGKDRQESVDFPLMILKSDGASVYATRDLATGIYRQQRWQPAKILYVVGGEQKFYFETVFAVMRLLGVTAELKHIMFGLVTVRGEDGKAEKMSTRAGKVVLLEDLIREAVSRAGQIIAERSNQSLTVEERETVARQVGIGAIKYQDLKRDRTSGIAFDWNQMLSFEGNSSPRIQYDIARVNSLLAKAGEVDEPNPEAFGDEERPVLLKIAAYPGIILEAANSYEPHKLAEYLFEVVQTFSAYYNAVPINNESDPETRTARLTLARMVGEVLQNGLSILGIESPQQM